MAYWSSLFSLLALTLVMCKVFACTNFQGPTDNLPQSCIENSTTSGNPPVFYMASRVDATATPAIQFQSNDTRMESGKIYYPCPVVGGFPPDVGPYGALYVQFQMTFTSANSDAPFLCVSHETDAVNKVTICLSATGETFYTGYRRGIPYNSSVLHWAKFPASGGSYLLTIDFLTPDASYPDNYLSASINNQMPFMSIVGAYLLPFGITVPANETFIQPGYVVIYGDANYFNHSSPNDYTVYSLTQVNFTCTPSQPSVTVVPPRTCDSIDFGHLNCPGQPAVIMQNVTVSNLTATDVGNCGGCTGVTVNGTLEVPTGAVIKIPVDAANLNSSFLNVSGCARFQGGAVVQISIAEFNASSAKVNVLSAQCIEGLDKVHFQVETKNSSKRYCFMTTATIHEYNGAMSLLLALSACHKRIWHWWIYLLLGLAIVTCVTVVTAITLTCFCKEWQPQFRKSRVRAVTAPLLLPY